MDTTLPYATKQMAYKQGVEIMSNHDRGGWGDFDRFESAFGSFGTEWTLAYPSLDPNTSPSITDMKNDLNNKNQDFINSWGDLGNFGIGDGKYTSPDSDLDGFKALPNWHLSKSLIGAGVEFRTDESFSWGIAAGYFPAGSRGDGRDPFRARNSWGSLPYIPGGSFSTTLDGHWVDGGRGGNTWVPGERTFTDSNTLMVWASWSF